MDVDDPLLAELLGDDDTDQTAQATQGFLQPMAAGSQRAATPVGPLPSLPAMLPSPTPSPAGPSQSAVPSSTSARSGSAASGHLACKELCQAVAQVCPEQKAKIQVLYTKLREREQEGGSSADALYKHCYQYATEIVGQEGMARAVNFVQTNPQLFKSMASLLPAPASQPNSQHTSQPAAQSKAQPPLQPAAQPLSHVMLQQQQRQQQQQQGAAAASGVSAGAFNQHLRVTPPQQAQPPARPPQPPAQPQVQLQSQPQKRPAETSPEDRDAKKAKPASAGVSTAKKKEEKRDDVDEELNADAFIDMERETDALMIDIHRRRESKQAEPASHVQYLSEWRVGNEIYRQMMKQGLKEVDPRCFEVVQLAWQAHASNLLQAAQRSARHRQDACRRAPDVRITSDVRRPLGQIAKRDQERFEAKLAKEREALLKMAGSKRADEETKEKAQKAKAEMQGRQQASAANAAVAATLGGKGAKWDKWGAGGGGTAGGRAAGKGATEGGGKATAKKGKKAAGAGAEAAEAAALAQKDAHTAAAFDAPAAAAKAAAAAPAAATKAEPAAGLQSARSRPKLTPGDDGGDTITTRDIVAAMERDPVYCRSTLLFSLLNGGAIATT